MKLNLQILNFFKVSSFELKHEKIKNVFVTKMRYYENKS